MEEGQDMNTCIFHGKYIGSECPKCNVNQFDSKTKKHSSFPVFILKNSILMFVGMILGYLIFTL